MKIKYYTPTIEEFHVGFEFEYLNLKNQWIKSNDFSETFSNDDTDTISEVGRYLDNSEIRAKRLDREDIESLGFLFTEEDILLKYLSKKQESVFTAFFTDELITKIQSDFVISISKVLPNYINIHVDEDNKGSHLIFRGKIKNKSELQKLMIQLEIK